MTPAIDSRELVALLVDVSIKAAVFALVVEAALRALKVQHAAFAHSMWVGVAAGMMLFPALRLYMPTIWIPLLPASAGSGEPSSLVDPEWGTVLAAVYAVGVVGLLGRLTLGLALGARLVATSRPVEDRAWTGFARDQARVTTWRRAPVLCESRLVRVPMTIGIVRPVVVLPEGWRDWGTLKTKSVLAHELAHVRRGDFAWQLMCEINRCLFWFHPVAWLLRRRVSLAAERACDDSAILTIGDRCTYARHLVDIAAALQGQRGRVLATAIPMAAPCQIRPRVEAILDRNRKRSHRLGRGGAFFAVTLASIVWVSAASVSWRQCAKEAKATPALEAACGEAKGVGCTGR